MKKLFLMAFATMILQIMSAQMLFSYDFVADTIGKPLNGRNGWSNMSRDSFPGIGASVGTEGAIKKDTLAYAGFYATLKGLDLTKGDGVGHFTTINNTLPNGYAPTYVSGDKIYAAFLYKPSTAVSDSGGNSAGQIFRLYGKDRFVSGIVAMRLLVQKKGQKCVLALIKTLQQVGQASITTSTKRI